MASLSLELPSMYGDHHVINVRQILLEMDGVNEVYASSGFRVVEVEYNSKKTPKKDLIAALEKAGYTSDFNLPEELSIPANEQKENAFPKSMFQILEEEDPALLYFIKKKK